MFIGCGNAVVDHVIRVDGYPEPDAKVRSLGPMSCGVGGNALVSCMTAARLGAHTHLVSRIADDANGSVLDAQLAQAVGAALVARDAAFTSMALVVVDVRSDTRTIIYTPGPRVVANAALAQALDRLLGHAGGGGAGGATSVLMVDAKHGAAALLALQRALPVASCVTVLDAEADCMGVREWASIAVLAHVVVCNVAMLRQWVAQGNASEHGHLHTDDNTGQQQRSGGGVDVRHGDVCVKDVIAMVHSLWDMGHIRASCCIVTMGPLGAVGVVPHGENVVFPQTTSTDATASACATATPATASNDTHSAQQHGSILAFTGEDMLSLQTPHVTPNSVCTGVWSAPGAPPRAYDVAWCPAVRLERVESTLGAGDVFIGALGTALLSPTRCLRRSLALACWAGGEKVAGRADALTLPTWWT